MFECRVLAHSWKHHFADTNWSQCSKGWKNLQAQPPPPQSERDFHARTHQGPSYADDRRTNGHPPFSSGDVRSSGIQPRPQHPPSHPPNHAAPNGTPKQGSVADMGRTSSWADISADEEMDYNQPVLFASSPSRPTPLDDKTRQQQSTDPARRREEEQRKLDERTRREGNPLASFTLAAIAHFY